MTERKNKLNKLIEKYLLFKEEGRLDLSSEETMRTWINEFLSIFGWDVMDTSQILQEKVLSKEEKEKLKKIDSTSTRPDYTFKIGSEKLTFLDAKSINVNIKEHKNSAFQIKSYGWSILAPCAFLTNFEEFAIYDCTYIPQKDQEANLGRIYLKIEEYIDNFELLDNHLFKSNIINGKLSDLYTDTFQTEGIVQKISPDIFFAEQLSNFRLSLAMDLITQNNEIINNNTEQLAYLTQVIINRIIFIRICEARRIEKEGLLLNFLENGFWNEFKKSSYNEFYNHYDGPLFDRINVFQEINISDEVIKELLDLLYYPSPYKFDVIPSKMLSDIYEIFLSKKLIIKDGIVSEKLKLEYMKTNGAVSTPKYLVQDLLKRTITKEKLIESGISGILNTKILDFACGSGIFIIETFDYLQNIIIECYSSDQEEYSDYFFVNDSTVALTIKGKRELISNCLFGIDIDPEAVEVSKMSLSLKIIDSMDFIESYHDLGIFGSQILNNIGTNIKCGNTLVENDIRTQYPDLLEDEAQLFRTNPFEWNGDDGFSDIFNIKGGFDFIIGNPPYVEVKNYNIEYPLMYKYIKQNFETASNGKIDLSIPFIERAITLLNENGKLGLIIQKRFFKTDYGKKMRRFITSNNLLHQIIDFESTDLFKNRITYIVLLVLDKVDHNMIHYYKVNDLKENQIKLTLNSLATLESNNNDFTVIPLNAFDQNPWSFENAELLQIKTELLEFGKFGDVVNVKVGIQVLWDKAYHIKVKKINNDGTITGDTFLEKNITIEINACRPLLVNKSFYPFCLDTTDVYTIFPYDTSLSENNPILFNDFCNRFPYAGEYLVKHKEHILNNVKTKSDDQKWHLFTRPNNHTAIYPKILIPMTANDSFASITQNPLNYCDNANMFFIEIPDNTETNLYAIAGIINSIIFSVFARSIANPQQNGYFKFNKQFLEPIPFPKDNFINNTNLVNDIAIISENIDQRQTQYKSAPPRQKNIIKVNLKSLWNNLDDKVFELYQLNQMQIEFFNSHGRNIDRIEILN